MAIKYKKNPTTHSQPDLFTSFGDTPNFIALDELGEDAIRSLPRLAFTDDEWEELDEETQEWIYEHDKESKKRVDTMAKNLVERVADNGNPEYLMDRAEGDIDYFFSDDDRLWRDHGEFIRDWANEEMGDNYDEEELKQAAIDVGLTMANADWEITTGPGDIHVSTDGFWLSRDGLDYMMYGNPELYTYDEIERAIKKAEEDDQSYDRPTVSDEGFEADEFWALIHGERARWGRKEWVYPEIQHEGSYDWFSAVVTWNEEEILNDIREALGWEPGAPAEEFVEHVPEDRVLASLELSDGTYNVIDLLPEELKRETKKMNHCVGKQQYGYANAIRSGRTRILSVRPDGGDNVWKRTITMEVTVSPPDNTSNIKELVDEDKIVEINQMKGTRNRVPGFGRPLPGQRAEVKDFTNPDEFKNMVKVANALGFNVDDVPDLQPGFHAYKAMKSLPGHKKNPPRKVYIEMPMQTFDMPAGKYA